MNPFEFIQNVSILCSKHRGSVTSWGRTLKHNKEIGGVEGSLHTIWIGCDVVLDEMKRSSELESDAEALGLVAMFEGDHYHLQPQKIFG